MRMEINVPDEFMGTVIGDISSKRGSIASTEKKGKTTIIKAVAPLSELSGYVTTLRSLTQGRGTSYMEPSHYEEVPMNIVKEMQEK
jgi:elongation factor G